MKSAIIINLDYERHSVQICRRIWEEISHSMETAGFSQHYRIFLAELEREVACERAKNAVSAAEDRLANEGIVAFDAIREFYGFAYEQTNDLLALANELPEVTFVDSDAFHPLLNTGLN